MNRLTRALADHCRQHLLEEKWLLAPSLRVGHQWLEAVCRHGQPVANVHVKTLKSMAVDLAAADMAARQLTMASARAAGLLVDRVLRRLRADRLAYLKQVQPSAGLAETVLASVTSMRLAGLDMGQVDADQFEVAPKGRDLLAIVETYLELLKEEHLLDYAGVLELATQRLVAEPSRLGDATLVLVPQDPPCAALETRLLQALPNDRRRDLRAEELASSRKSVPTDLELLRWVLQPATAPAAPADGSVRVTRAVGEVNEVRHALRQCVGAGMAWDEVELLHTDGATYVPLVYETLSAIEWGTSQPGDELPVTFAEGISCRYSRPGRALVGWLRWVREGFPQALLVKMIKEGLLDTTRREEEQAGFTRLAGLLRGVGIGFGRERYLPKLKAGIAALENKCQAAAQAGAEEEGPSSGKLEQLRRDVRDLRVVERLCVELLDGAPPVGALSAGAPQQEVITAATKFLETTARAVSKLDSFAAQKLRGELSEMQHWLSRDEGLATIDVWEWLETLPAETRVLGSGPRPGCLHVDSIYSGGHSGRRQTFIVGLDDSRFPGAGLQDPLLLDSERKKLSPHIPTAADRLDETLEDFARLLGRLRGRLDLSFACQSVSDDREMFPSPVLLSVFRLLTGNPAGDQQELLDWLPPPVSFAPTDAHDCLDMSEWWLWRLTDKELVEEPQALALRHFPHLARGRTASAARRGSTFSAYDGHVPQAGEDLDPTSATGPVMSSSGLQTIGSCPRAFFFKYGLDIAPPDDVSVDPSQWLDALARGSLLHELFEQFMRELIDKGRLPQYQRDHARLEHLLGKQINEYKDRYPPPGDSAYRREVQQLERTASTFLREEERFCARNDSRPVYLEASLGMPPEEHATPLDALEPIPVPLADGRQIRVRGRVDRIDRVDDAALQTYGIWDYKTGSTWGYDAADPFKQGRKVQPFLYVTMVAHGLRKSVDARADVKYFGFFFPGVKAVGERIHWTPKQLAAGKDVLEQLCRTVANGAFVATNDFKYDCTYCDYRPICGNVEAVSAETNIKLEDEENTLLEPFRELR